jgi:hypothetical protein
VAKRRATTLTLFSPIAHDPVESIAAPTSNGFRDSLVEDVERGWLVRGHLANGHDEFVNNPASSVDVMYPEEHRLSPKLPEQRLV